MFAKSDFGENEYVMVFWIKVFYSSSSIV